MQQADDKNSALPPKEPPLRSYPLPPLPPGHFYVEPDDPRQVGPGGAFVVEDADPFDNYHYRVKAILHASRSPFQDIVIADTYNFGRALFLDGAIQSSAEDEALYHEMLTQPALLMHQSPRDVLIVGGGEGATLREVLAHRSVHRAVMIDLDRDVVEICREMLPTWHCGAFADPRAELLYMDGRAFLESSEDFFDVIIVDVVDMLEDGPAQRLYTRQFYELARARLRPGGIIVVQGLEFSFVDYKAHTALARTLRTVFAEVHSYQVCVPSFLGNWGFLIASDTTAPSDISAESLDREIMKRLGPNWLEHATGSFIQACFCHCKETQFYLDLPGPILQDGEPFIEPPDIEEEEPFGEQLPALRD
ncbi:fused MFS/spermidine synthase [Mesorhizobium sp. NZP2077]|uniref:fused MFS/spermidine synthase n=1 Tax=Mesorhizobium sp. NZP2077 TaxID=2483404 RepID=UPI001554D4C7|nr:fused MFS/spermidine synthase [Mesorhizobium sp. NZP2077]QKC85333.1 spermidine synthase [Mesorhizobium sp. NZP2077]QKD18976.1 fused MFS/spermidine synthase [Mesorhizobium sp. NZP2077]